MPLVLPSSIHDPATSTVAPSTWGDGLNAACDYLGRDLPHCRVYNNAAISVPNSTVTALTFNSERVDIGGLHSTVTNTSRLTIVDAGFYLVWGTIQFAASAGGGTRQIAIRVNGTTTIAALELPAPAAVDVPKLAICTVYQMAAGDYFELLAVQFSGGALNVNSTGNASPEFGCLWQCV